MPVLLFAFFIFSYVFTKYKTKSYKMSYYSSVSISISVPSRKWKCKSPPSWTSTLSNTTMYIYLFPFGFQYTFITLPQLGHFSDTIIQPEPVSPMSQARFLHHLSGHFIFRIIPPPLPPNTSIAISPH